MIVITAHNMIDFDALASMVAARKLYPQSQLVFSGIIAKSAREFVVLNKDLLDIRDVRTILPRKVKHLIVVDTANPKRLPGFEEILSNPDLVIHIYDHHLAQKGDLQGDFKQVEMVGAATTLLVERLKQQGTELNEFEATTMALGIYADTGGMIYNSTTTRDMEAVAWLLSQGANLEIIRENMDQRLSDQQMKIFHECLLHMQIHSVGGVDVLICQASVPKRVGGLDVVTMRLFAVEGTEAIFVLVEDPKSVQIVGRSSSHYVDVSKILQPFEGRGHVRAASATVKKKKLEEVISSLTESINKNVYPSRCAKDIMTTPVKTLLPDVSLQEADKIMLRCGHGGMPVVQDGQILGMISRRDVDKARMHHLEHLSVKGFMSSHIIKAKLDTPLDQLQTLIVSHDIGRIPIIEDEKLVGIVSRSDILRELYQKKHEADSVISDENEMDEVNQTWNYAQHMQENLPEEILNIFQLAGEIAEKNQQKAYIVGGFVRDLLLEVPNQDIDLVVEGDGRVLAEQLAEQLQGEIRYFERFQTANIVLPNQKSLDVVTARAEYYEYPAALPQVEKSCIREDLYRRDFTINAMALCLNPDCFGDLIDFFGGRKDLKNQLIRVLYHFSFIEDPTRIVRAVRFSQRYHFTIERDTIRLALDALKNGMMAQLSRERFWHEIRMILKEPNPVPALWELRRLNILADGVPDVEKLAWNEEIFYLARRSGEWWGKHVGIPYQLDIVYVIILLFFFPEAWRKQIAGYMNLKNRIIQDMGRISKLLPWIETAEWGALSFSEMDQKLKGLIPEFLLYCMAKCRPVGRKKLREYVLKCQECKVFTDGERLKTLGFQPGPDFHRMLEKLYHLHLDGMIHTQEDEEVYLERWKRGEKIN